MINHWSAIAGSKIKALEIIAVLKGIKPCARIMVSEPNIQNFQREIEGISLSSSFSDFKVKKSDASGQQGPAYYSDTGSTIPLGAKEHGHIFAYIAKGIKTAEKAKALENSGNHAALGILLGYPECCAKFFEEQMARNPSSLDFTLAVQKNSDGFQFPFCMNIAARHFDISLLSHFPCSFRCEPSLAIAKNALQALKEEDPQFASEFEAALSSAAVYTETQGIFLLKDPRLEGSLLFYKGLMGTKDNQLCHMLRNADCITIKNKERLVISGLEIKNIGVMVFL